MLKLLVCLFFLFTQVDGNFQKGKPTREVINLDANTFEEATNDPSNPIWLLKFYAPWCGHCKKMAPILDKVAPVLEGKMSIGKIDCTVHKSLCSKFGVRGYPTLKFSVDGDIQDYPGNRDEMSIIAFAEKMSSPSVTKVGSYEEAMLLVAQSEVAFLGYDPSSTEQSQSELHQVFSKVARKLQASAYFMWLEGNEGQPFIHRIEAGVREKVLNENDITPEKLVKFVHEQNIPTVATLGPTNFNRIGNNGRPLVIAVVNEEKEEEVKMMREAMMKYIDGSDTSEDYYYGTINGKKWQKFLEQFRVVENENPQIIILDTPTKKFWQNSTYSNIFDFMGAVNDGTIQPAFATKGGSGASGFLGRLESAFIDYFPYSLGALLLIVFGFVFLLVPSEEDFHGEYLPREDLDEDESGHNENEEEIDSKKEK